MLPPDSRRVKRCSPLFLLLHNGDWLRASFESAYIAGMTGNDKPLPTIDDVARAAGVSTATVSRVLNRPTSVREKLRGRVAAAVARLGYVPHSGARSLMLGRTGTVGAIFPTVDNAIFAKAIDALQRRLAVAGHQLLIATSDYDVDTEMRQAVNLVTRGADALVLCGLSQRPELLQFLAQRALPCVHVMVHPGRAGSVSVGFDNAEAMAKAARYLIGLGHRRVAMLAGVALNNDRARQRIEGARRALRDAGLDLPPARLAERKYSIADARDGFRELMQHEPRPTALLCGNDVLAFGALLEAQKSGIAMPGELSIVGFDDLELARHVQPALTTIRVPAEELWRTAAERLLALLAGEQVARETEIEVSLVVRESTGPAPRLKSSPKRPAHPARRSRR
jgi:LacI family transcriptional regulator